MSEKVAVVIGTYGDDSWKEKAGRAAASAYDQTVKPYLVVRHHDETLHDARNRPAFDTDADWLIFLDADDELHPEYIERMLEAEGDIRQPSTLGVVDGKDDPFPVLIPEKNLMEGNYIVVGAMCRRDLFVQVGGFLDLPIYEDWDLWIRMWIAGAQIGKAPGAIYRLTVNSAGRNEQSQQVKEQYFRTIRAQYYRQAINLGLYTDV